MKLVLDTNILVSALLSPTGTCDRLLLAASHHAYRPVLTAEILAEYQEVLSRPHLGIQSATTQRLLNTLSDLAEVTAPPLLMVRLPDPDDLIFLSAAMAAHCPLVTGNHRHFPAALCHPVPILSPAHALTRLPPPR